MARTTLPLEFENLFQLEEGPELPAGQQDFAEQARKLAGADTAAVRYRFIARQEPSEPSPPMARILRGGGGRGGATRLKLYLSLLWLARNRSLDRPVFAFPAQQLAILLGLPHPDDAGARRVQEALRWLAREKFVALDRRPGDVTRVHLLDDAGSGEPYRPAGALTPRARRRSQQERERHFYVQLDARFWTKGWVNELSGAAIAMYLACLYEQRGQSEERIWVSPRMGRERYNLSDEVHRQALNVFRMKLLGAQVHSVKSGTRTLKDAMSEALRDWVTNVRSTYYLIGSTAGPHPYPMMVRDFQKVIGQEARRQILKMEGRLPDALVACVNGGSNAIGLFYPFLKDRKVRMIGVEAAGDGVNTKRHAATMEKGKPGILHGSRSYVLQDADGQIAETHSISAGLDYPGVGPEHAWLKDTKRAQYVSATDTQALEAFQALTQTEGILPALESSHAVYQAMRMAPRMSKSSILLVNLSGRGDKDVNTVLTRLGMDPGGKKP